MRKAIYYLLWLVAVPLLVVGVKYWQWERTLHVDETGRGFSVSLGDSHYARALEVVYFPAKTVLRPIERRLSYGGVLAQFAFDLTAVVLQHLGLLALLLALRGHRRHGSTRVGEVRSET
jgi:hypothetical protein